MPIDLGPRDPDSNRQEPPGVDDNPSGFTRPGGGYDPDGDGVLSPGRAAQIASEHEVRDSASSGSFSLDPDAMRELLPRWENVRDRLGKLMDDADLLKGIYTPAEDEASTKEIKAADEHQGIYSAIIRQQFDYAKEYAKGLRTAIEKLEESDRAAGEAVRNVGQTQ